MTPPPAGWADHPAAAALAARHRLRAWESIPWALALAFYFVFPKHLGFGTELLVTTLFAISLDLVLGYAGIVTLGQAAFFGAGAYTVGMLAKHGIWNEPITGLILAALVAALIGLGSGVVLLRSALFDSAHARYSFVTARPFLTLRAFGSQCELVSSDSRHIQFGNPWHLLDGLMSRYELLDEVDLPFPLGGCFGYWGYDLKNFVEPKLPRRAVSDLELPDCSVGFYDSLVVFDRRGRLGTATAVRLRSLGAQAQQRFLLQERHGRRGDRQGARDG